MTKDERGYWKETIEHIRPGKRYLFSLNNELERPDPASLSQPEGVHQPSEVIDLNHFEWTDGDWKGIHLNEMIIYEVHTGTFTARGDFQGIIDRLQHLVELGITAIE